MEKVLSSVNIAAADSLEITELEQRLEAMVVSIPLFDVLACSSKGVGCDTDGCDCASKGEST